MDIKLKEENEIRNYVPPDITRLRSCIQANGYGNELRSGTCRYPILDT
ncbi:hypothetical protein COLO4_37409 [Corchorus olitorius]|uniref:Uncharacterized protein n=1 Tax=Corchorus olitorius TaxID=93759 RepID=A0A1R3G225_9ROSI|nr:hypothetical protein COLO4_37409 [Corchorus olitorius]